MPNRLAGASSPYLLQHASNPVDWFEWGDEAFEEARRRDRPVLLSVGYAACHWCHVMAHESFEDRATADVMNRLFVNVKVDREERPDVDRVYMDAVQATTGRGGWPMTVFLTPSGEPFFAGTYFPKERRGNMPSFVQVLEAVAETWDTRREDVRGQASRITAAVARELPAADQVPGTEMWRAAYEAVEQAYDPVHGGFGFAPKFPQAPTLEFLLRIAGEEWAPRAEEMLSGTLTAMADGGIHDHLGGGFARYSVDERWHVPHFEKMLYDNALLARVYLRSSQVTGSARFEEVARSTLDYLLVDLRLPEGGFASAEDADSEGEEGRFYSWDLPEFTAAAGDDAGLAAAYYGVTDQGDFEGGNVLRRAASLEEAADRAGIDRVAAPDRLEAARRRLREVRDARVRPDLDDKAVCAWNSLAIRALAEAGAVLGEDRYLAAAVEGARFVQEHLTDGNGRLLRSWRRGRASIPGFADDHAATAVALFTLYQATGDPEWYREAARLTGEIHTRFWDADGGGVFATAHDGDRLIARPKNLFDNPTPSDNSLAAEAFGMLAAATGDSAAAARVGEIGRAGSLVIERAPTGAGHLLAVLHTEARRRELAVIGSADDPRTGDLASVVWQRFRPEVFLAVGDPSDPHPDVPLLADRPAGPGGAPLAYLCRDFVCEAPTADPDALGRGLG